MQNCKLYTGQPLIFNWVGKFEAPSDDWIHLKRVLTDYELFAVTSGTLYIADNVRQYVVNSGEFLLMPPTEIQYGYKASKCVFYWMHFSQSDFLPDDQSISIPIHSSLPRQERLIILLKQLQDSERRYHNRDLDNYLATTILYELYSQCFLYNNEKRLPSRGKAQIYTDIVDYVSWHLWEPIRVSEIAKYFGYNEKYLSTFFKKASGITLKTYILNEKMELAKALLTDTNDTVSQIAYSIGFQDNHNFSSCFKKITGLSPTEYRGSYAKRMLFHQ